MPKPDKFDIFQVVIEKEEIQWRDEHFLTFKKLLAMMKTVDRIFENWDETLDMFENVNKNWN